MASRGVPQRIREEHLEASLIQLLKKWKPESLKNFATQAEVELSISEQEIIDCILTLQAKGKITLKPQKEPTPQRMSKYSWKIASNWYGPTVVILIITTAIVIAIPENLYPVAVLRQILGSIFVLWWPGFSFTKAFFPSDSQGESLTFLERVAMSICMSLAIVSVVGLILNYTPWGVRLVPLVISLFSVAMILATIGVIREHKKLKRI